MQRIKNTEILRLTPDQASQYKLETTGRNNNLIKLLSVNEECFKGSSPTANQHEHEPNQSRLVRVLTVAFTGSASRSLQSL